MVCALSFLNSPDPYYLESMNELSLQKAKSGRGTAVWDESLEYLKARCRKCWRRKSTRAPHLSSAEYGGNFGVADANFIDMIKMSLPPAKMAGCVLLKDVLPEKMKSCYVDLNDTNLLWRPTDLELKITKRGVLVKPGTYLTVVAKLMELIIV